MYHYLAEHPEGQNNSHNRAEEYFKQFTHLLGEHFREERSVGFYARQLCITPKYLTTLIKRISGQSVSEWIDNYVILEPNPAQILDDEHTGDRLLPELPEPVVLRQLLQTQHGHVALAVQGAELTRASIRRNTSGTIRIR